jgi:hypothetical protein
MKMLIIESTAPRQRGEATVERGTTWKALLYWTSPVFYCRYLYRHLGLDYQGSARYYQGTVGYLGLG